MFVENEHWRLHPGMDASFDLVPHLGAPPYGDSQQQGWLGYANVLMKQDDDDMQMLWSVPESIGPGQTADQMSTGGPGD
jgi:hypothetical protein